MSNSTFRKVHIIGGGLAGTEAAWQLARAGVKSVIHEMRPVRTTEAHITGGLAELVCSNSLRSDNPQASAVGILHREMRYLDSLVLACADANRVPAGSALAVDRNGFSRDVEKAIEAEPMITVQRHEITEIPDDWDSVIIATGPLTSNAMAETIKLLTGADELAFFDAIAPIVIRDTIDFNKAWFQSRYDKGEGKDYINCPLDHDQYQAFINALVYADRVEFREWEKNTPYFEGCLPIEIMAKRGPRSLSFGPMKPVGLTNPHAPNVKPAAVVQLRQDNALGTLYNMVGFQTKLTHASQKRIFTTIPGLENAEFARLGGIHRNTFINSPKLLNKTLALKLRPQLRFAGQITGCEGYVESAAMGLLAGRFAAAEITGTASMPPPHETALGALLDHVTGGAEEDTFQPMKANFGLFPPIEWTSDNGRPPRGREKKEAISARAQESLDRWLTGKQQINS